MIWRREEQPESEGDSPESLARARVEEILEAAEKAALEIRQYAEERARAHLEDSKRRADELAGDRIKEMSDLTDAILERARSVAEQSDQLIASLEEAERRLTNSPPGSGATEESGDEPAGAPPSEEA